MKTGNFNLPNFLTILRILLVPFFIYCLFQEQNYYKILAFVLFSFASLTDLVDGYLARKWKQETEFGKFLDPLADKVLVVGAFLALILLDEQIELWMVLLIILRDMLITSLRYIAIKGGKSIRTTRMGKIKTTFQMGSIAFMLTLFIFVKISKSRGINALYRAGREAGENGFTIAYRHLHDFLDKGGITFSYQAGTIIEDVAMFLPYYVMLITTLITVLSGIRYLYSNRELLNYREIYRVLSQKDS